MQMISAPSEEATSFAAFLTAGRDGFREIGLENVSRLLDVLPKYITAQLARPGSEARLVSEIAGVVGRDRRAVAAVMEFFAFFSLPEFQELTTEEVISDFKSDDDFGELFIGDIPLDRILGEYLPRISIMRNALVYARNCGVAIFGVAPSFESVSATIEARAIFADEPNAGTGTEPYGTVAVASILLNLDSGPVDSISFQASKSDLDEIIEYFEKTRSRIEKLETKLQGVEWR